MTNIEWINLIGVAYLLAVGFWLVRRLRGAR